MSRHPYAGAAAHLGAAELAVVLDALGDAAEYRSARGSQYCAACEAEYGGLCYDHAGDLDRADRYAELGRQIRRAASR
jgi:hypothetical protein